MSIASPCPPPDPQGRPRDGVAVVAAQLALLTPALAFDLSRTGGIGFMLPALALFIGAFGVMFARGQRRSGWPDRPRIVRIGWSSGLSMWAVGAAGYAALYLRSPDLYGFQPSALIWAAPVVGLLPGLGGLLLTICAGDAARTALGVEPPPSRDRW